MAKLRLPKEEQQRLRDMCRLYHSGKLTDEQRAAIHLAFFDMMDFPRCDALTRWLWRSVIDGWTWARLEVECIPCSRDTFQLFRARFYSQLSLHLSEFEAGPHAEE